MGKLLKSEIEAAARQVIRKYNEKAKKKAEDYANSKKYKDEVKALKKKYKIDAVEAAIKKANDLDANIDLSIGYHYNGGYGGELKKLQNKAVPRRISEDKYSTNYEFHKIVDAITLEQVDSKMGLTKFLDSLAQDLIDKIDL